MRIYKYVLRVGNRPTLDMPCEIPEKAQIISAGLQQDTDGSEIIAVWALVDLTMPREMRWFSILMTGEEINAGMVERMRQFVGTVQLKNGIVAHVWATDGNLKDRR